MARKALTLSKSIPDKFPNIDVLLSYVSPVTSESLGHEGANPKITWSKEPNVAALASACELFFEWGYKEAIIKRFRTVIWPGAVLRILRRAVLDVDALGASSFPATPFKNRNSVDDDEEYGTPSKMIAKHFSAIDLNSDAGGHESNNSESRLILNISRERNHVSTDGLPEYRLEITPAQLVNIALPGIQGLRQPEGPNEWASDEDEEADDDEEEGREKKKKGKAKEPVDPMSHLRLWMPACMVDPVEKRLVRDFREAQERKSQKKKAPAKKKATTKQPKENPSPKTKTKASAKTSASTSTRAASPPPPQSKRVERISKTNTSKPPSLSQPKTVEKLRPQTPTKPIPQPFPIEIAARGEEEESSDDEGELPIIPIPAPISKAKATKAVSVTARPPKKPSRPTTSSKTSQVAAIFSTSASIPSSQTIEAALALSDSDDELPMDIYQSIRPKKPIVSTIPGYLSLSDTDDPRLILTSPVKRKNTTSKKRLMTQTTLSDFVGRAGHRMSPSENLEDGPNFPPKSPRKYKSHVSPRSKGQASAKVTKEEFSIIVISDNSDHDDGYSGVSRPALASLQLAHNHTKRGGFVPARPKASTATSEVIDLT
jgi:Holliday junction resolvase YEN1